jgi:hypothetical protein
MYLYSVPSLSIRNKKGGGESSEDRYVMPKGWMEEEDRGGSSSEDDSDRDRDELVDSTPLLRVHSPLHGKDYLSYKVIYDVKDDEYLLDDSSLLESHFLILLLRSGKFAAAIFKKGELQPQHKTFSRYTVRKKQGGAQSKSDNSHGKAISIGSQIRRYNEQELEKEVMAVLTSWSDEIKRVSRIFVVLPYKGKGSFIYGKDSPIVKGDRRVRSVPFPTHRPTLEECKAAYERLVTLQEVKDYSDMMHSVIATVPDDVVPEKEMATLGIKTKPSPSLAAPSTSTTPALPVLLAGMEYSNNETIESFAKAVASGDGERVKLMLAADPLLVHETFMFREIPKTTALHAASILGHASLVSDLLLGGASPETRDGHSRLSYMVAGHKLVRDAFRRFMGLYPHAWNWDITGLPEVPLTEELEKEKKAKAKAKKKRARENKRSKGGVALEEEEGDISIDSIIEEHITSVVSSKAFQDKLSRVAGKVGMGLDFLRNVVTSDSVENPDDLLNTIELALDAGILPHEILMSVTSTHSNDTRGRTTHASNGTPPPLVTIPVSNPAPKKEPPAVFDQTLLNEPAASDEIDCSRVQFKYDAKRFVRRVNNKLPVAGLYNIAATLTGVKSESLSLYTTMPTRYFAADEMTTVGDEKISGCAVYITRI